MKILYLHYAVLTKRNSTRFVSIKSDLPCNYYFLLQKLLPVVLSHIPAGTSTRTVIHYLQEIKNNGNFQKFDYGPAGNMIVYGNSTPPAYNITNIKVPTYLMYAENDWLASPIVSLDIMV